MISIITLISVILLMLGSFFFIAGSIGLNRLPDVYTRLHATTKCDTLGQSLILLGVVIYDGMTFTSLKILIIAGFLLLANPTGAHALAKGAYISGVRLCENTEPDEYRDLCEEVDDDLAA